MAVSLLDSGNSGAVATNATTTVAVTVSAGAGNRKLLIGITLEDFTGNAAPATVTFNGQDLVALGLAVPGASNNQQSACRTIFYEQFEGGMPAPGSHNIAVTWTATTGGAVVAYWLVDGARQDQLATGNANGSNQGGASGTTLTAAVTAGDADAFLCSVAYRNNTTGTLQLTAPASSTTRFDNGAATGGSRLSGGDKTGSLTVGSNNVTWTFSSTTDRRSMAVALVNSAPNSRSVSGNIDIGAAEVAASLDALASIDGDIPIGAAEVAATVFHDRSASGDVESPPITVDGLGSVAVLINSPFVGTPGTVSIGAVEVAGTLVHPISISGDISIGAAQVAGFIGSIREISGDIEIGAVEVAGTVVHPVSISGDIEIGAAEVGGALEAVRAISGDISIGAVEVAGSVLSPIFGFGSVVLGTPVVAASLDALAGISGDIEIGAVEVAGTVARRVELGGNVQLGAVQVAGAVRTQFPGSVMFRDRPAGSVVLSDGPAGSANLHTTTAGTVELDHR